MGRGLRIAMVAERLIYYIARYPCVWDGAGQDASTEADLAFFENAVWSQKARVARAAEASRQ